jgi:hypothetical protein
MLAILLVVYARVFILLHFAVVYSTLLCTILFTTWFVVVFVTNKLHKYHMNNYRLKRHFFLNAVARAMHLISMTTMRNHYVFPDKRNVRKNLMNFKYSIVVSTLIFSKLYSDITIRLFVLLLFKSHLRYNTVGW